MKKCKKNKAFFGALIGAGVNIASSIFNSNRQQQITEQQMKFQKEQAEKQEKLRKDAAEQNYYNALNANSDIYNDLRASLNSYKYGGKIKKCKRKKSEFGTIFDGANFDTSKFLGDIFQNIGSGVSNYINSKSNYNIESKKLDNERYIADLNTKSIDNQTPNFNNIRSSLNERTQNIYNGDDQMQTELKRTRIRRPQSLYLS